MHFLVLDTRFPTAVHVFLEGDPRTEPGFPGLAVRRVTLDAVGGEPKEAGSGVSCGTTVGQDPWRADHFRAFASDRAAGRAGFGLVEPRFVGPTWAGYDKAFGFGKKSVPRPR